MRPRNGTQMVTGQGVKKRDILNIYFRVGEWVSRSAWRSSI